MSAGEPPVDGEIASDEDSLTPETDAFATDSSWRYSLSSVLDLAGYRDGDLLDSPLAACGRSVDSLSDSELHSTIRSASSADRRAILELLKLPKGTTPSPSQMEMVRRKFRTLEDDQRVHAVSHLARRGADQLDARLSEIWGTPVPSEESDPELAAFLAALAEVATDLARETSPALARLAAFGLSLRWPSLGGAAYRAVALDSEAADPDLVPGPPDYERLDHALRSAEDWWADRQAAVEAVANDLLASRFPTSTDLATLTDMVIVEASMPFVGFGEALRRLARDRGLDAPPDRATLTELRAHLALCSTHDAENGSPGLTDLPAMQVEGSVASAIEDLTAAAANEEQARAAIEQLVELVELTATGDDALIDDAAERLTDLLHAYPAWLAAGNSARAVVNATLRGRVRLSQVDHLLTVPSTSPDIESHEDTAADSLTGSTPEPEPVVPDPVELDSVEPQTPVADSTSVAEVAAPTSAESPYAKSVSLSGSNHPQDELSRPTSDDPSPASPDGPVPHAPPTPATGTPVDRIGDGDPELARLELMEDIEARATDSDRHGLAAEAAAASESNVRADAHRALALAQAMRSSTGPVAAALLPIFARLAGGALNERSTVPLVLAAVLRATIYSTSVEILSLLSTLRGSFAHDPGTIELIDIALQVARADTNVSAASTALRHAAELDDAVAAASAAAAEELRTGASRTNKYTAATIVWATWIRSDGILGSLLDAAANDDRARLDEVTSRIAELRDRSRLIAEMRSADARATKRNQIIAGARDRLLDWATHALSLAASWVEAARASDAASGSGPVASGLLGRLREVSRTASTGDLLIAAEGDSITVACNRAAGRSVLTTLAIFVKGTDETSDEPDPGEVLLDDLLLGGVPVRSGDGVPAGIDIAVLQQAAEADPTDTRAWEIAFEAHSKVMDHDATARIVDRIADLDEQAGEEAAARRAVALERAREVVRVEQRQVEDLLASGRSHGHLDDGEWSALSGRLLSASPSERTDLGQIRGLLADIRSELEVAREAAFRGLHERLATATQEGGIEQSDLDRINERIAESDIATAEEYLALAVDGQPLPSTPVDHGEFRAWWPDLAAEQSKTVVDSRLANAARKGSTSAVVDFSHLDPATRLDVSAGLEAWTTLSAGKPRGQLIDTARPLLALLGIEASEMAGVPKAKATNDREWRQIVGFKRTGRALVPDFGTQSSGAATGDTLLCLLAWGNPRPGTIASWISQEGSTRPVMVWYFGALEPADRVGLADELRSSHHRRPVVVLDDAIVTYAAAAGGRNYETVMRLALPFAAVNPYQSVGGLTPVEMFYGRQAERASLGNLTGSALVYGGRQLGKSSLLRATGRDFDDGLHRRSLYLDLKAHGIGTTRAPEAIWELLWRSLASIGVLSGEPAESQIRTKLQEGLMRWLDSGTGRALLVLLDECDLFLSADADTRFDTVDALDDLMTETGRRTKFVFAGLHRVQRFKSIENQPLAHLGAPIAVGPLRAPEAMALVYKPAAALGYRFEHDELPARILAFCNNNPSLIVLFMQALIDRMLSKPLRRAGGIRPPVVITDDDVEATYSNGTLAELIRERFELTLDLDPAYKVIAYTVAHEAREQGEGIELSVRELREMSTGWWPRGLADVGIGGFRVLCDELVDLGVLANRHGNYGLRSPNILRFLGSAEQIADVLLEAEHLRPSETFDSSSARPRIGTDSDRRSPLTAAQIADVIAPRNQIRLVVGSPLAGIDRAETAIRSAAEGKATVDVADATTTRLSSFRNTAGRHRILILDLDTVDTARAVRLVAEGVDLRRNASGTLGLVFIASSKHLDLWRSALSGDDQWDRVGLMETGRVDAAAWRYWISEAELPFTDDTSAEHVLDRSGGWLGLLEIAAVEGRARGRRRANDRLDELRHADVAADLLTQAGITGPLLEAFTAICEYYPEGGEYDAITEAAAIGGAEAVDVEILRIIGALDVDTAGIYRPERVLAAATIASIGD